MIFANQVWLKLDHHIKKWQIYIPKKDNYNTVQPGSITTANGSNLYPAILPISLLQPHNKKELIPIYVKKITPRQYKIGPVIGILSVLYQQKLQGNRLNFIDILNTIRKTGGVGYVFTPSDIQWEKGLIWGRIYDPRQKKWIQLQMPFPDVVYNRIPNRTYENQPEVQLTLQKLKEQPNLSLFNPHFFNKWELYKILDQTNLKVHLPKTLYLKEFDQLNQMLELTSTLYIKPIHSKAGIGILLLSQKGQQYQLITLEQGKKITYAFHTIQELWAFLKNVNKNGEYLIQEAIPLLTYEGSPFDARVLVQKDYSGRWQVTGIGFRVAGNHGISTHVPLGGRIIHVSEGLYPHFGKEDSKELLTKIENLAIKIADTLEVQYGLLGEMSMDVGITKEKKIWFFEANAKPMKFDEPNIRKSSLINLVDYCCYLSGFPKGGIEHAHSPRY